MRGRARRKRELRAADGVAGGVGRFTTILGDGGLLKGDPPAPADVYTNDLLPDAGEPAYTRTARRAR